MDKPHVLEEMFKSNKFEIEEEMAEEEKVEDREISGLCIDIADEVRMKAYYRKLLELEIMKMVLHNDLLLENILKHVIYPTSIKDIDRSNLGNLRLVQKSWLGCVGDILRKNLDFLFHFELNKENSVDGCVYINDNGMKLLPKINSILSNPVGRTKSYQTPTFALRILPEFFRKENYQDLAECLERHGHSLTDLDVSFPLNSSMTLTFLPFTLPKLVRLAVQFTDQRVVPETENAGQQSSTPQTQSVYPLQTFLNATTELAELQFHFTTSESLMPPGFDFLRLPSTIKSLFLDCPVKNQDLQMLLKNDLPHLSHLRLFGTNIPYAKGLIFQILSKFRTSLKILNLRGNHYPDRGKKTTLIRMPIMEKLETITVTFQTWEMEENADNPINWGSCLPTLKELRLLHQPERLFRRWANNSRYESVTRLFISLIDNSPGATGFVPVQEQPLTFDLQRMQLLHLAFPNVTSLEITMCGMLTCGLKYMFMEMRNLCKLAINLKGSPPDQALHWDALLIGVPPDMAACLRRNPDFWPSFMLTNDSTFPSIRMMTGLTTLAFVDNLNGSASSTSDNPGMRITNSLISDLSFVFGFLKMPKLKYLLLDGRFKASEAMAERWKQEKGTPIHSRKPFH